jgi:hypothetical protein
MRIMHLIPPRPLPLPLTLAIIPLLALCACSGGTDENGAGASPVPNTPSPPPSYSSSHLKARLLSSGEVGDDIRAIPPAIEALQRRQVPMCSLSGVDLQGGPETLVRQYTNPARGRGEIKYAQFVARYPDAKSAEAAFGTLRQRARACAPKRHVPAKKTRRNFVIFAHDDVWKTSEGTFSGWKHLRGSEQQTYPASASKVNVLHLMHDYAVRGNVVLTTVYWERAEPKKSSDPIARRATELLRKQLQKFG